MSNNQNNANSDNNINNIKNKNNETKEVCVVSYVDNDYPVDVASDIPPVYRSNNPYNSVPPPPKNGGLYSGPESDLFWMPEKVIPTTTYFMQELLKNADPPPPPGATEQYPGDNRLGNNYIPMPGVNWFNSQYKNRGPYNIKVIDKNHIKSQQK